MKKLTPIVAIAALAIVYFLFQGTSFDEPSSLAAEIALQNAFVNRQSGIQVMGAGKVEKILEDDLEGSRHQKFIVMLGSGETMLISHNIDLAPRIDSLQVGDRVDFYGEYEWNPKGGVIHWTHRDPEGRHFDGWIKHRGRTYQ